MEEPGRAFSKDSEAKLRPEPHATSSIDERPVKGTREGEAQPGASAAEAIDRATAAFGQDDGKR